MENYFLAIALFLFIGLFVVGSILFVNFRAKDRIQNELNSLNSERISLFEEIQKLRDREGERAEEIGSVKAQIAERLREAVVLKAEIENQKSLAFAEHEKLEKVRYDYAKLQAKHAETCANLVHADQAKTEIKSFLEDAQEKLSAAFSSLAGKTFGERGQQFEKNVREATQQSKTDIETLLKPFASQIGEFRARVDSLYSDEARERATLVGAVNELKTLNQDMAQQASALTRALKGNAKVRGDWGELMLETVLKDSGLVEGVHYDRQKSTTDDDGKKLRPDVVIRLPEDRKIVIDSKVNLIDWQAAMNAETPEEQQEAIRRHVVALKRHVKDLGETNYPRAIGESALEVTIAFVPIEGALSAALGISPELQGEAFSRGVAFASPNTLMAVLRVVDRLWTRDKIQRQAQEISESGGKVLDALQIFIEDFDQTGKKLEDATTAFRKARAKLSESSHAVIPRARRLAQLGAKGKKPLSEELKQEHLDVLPTSASVLPILLDPINDSLPSNDGLAVKLSAEDESSA